MNTPWHQDTLDGLVAYLGAQGEQTEATVGVSWAVVIASSEWLAGEVVGELRERLARTKTLSLCSYLDARTTVTDWLKDHDQSTRCPTIVEGLVSIIRSPQAKVFLAWINLQREELARSRASLIFVLSRDAADRWVTGAADIDRYTQHFEFVDWDDLVEDANSAAASSAIEVEAGHARRDAVDNELKRARRSGIPTRIVSSLLAQAAVLVDQEQYSVAEDALNEAADLLEPMQETEPMQSGIAILRAQILDETDRTQAALEQLRSTNARARDNLLALDIAARVYTDLGRFAEATITANRILNWEKQHRDLGHAHLATIYFRQARFREAMEHARQIPPSSPYQGIYGYMLILAGRSTEGLESVLRMIQYWNHREIGSSASSAMRWLSLASLTAGYPRRALEILNQASSTEAAAICVFDTRAYATSILRGPAAVSALVATVEGWFQTRTSFIRMAELSNARALGSRSEDDAYRHFKFSEQLYSSANYALPATDLPLRLARLERLRGDLDQAATRVESLVALYTTEGVYLRLALAQTELAMIELGRGRANVAREKAIASLELCRHADARLFEPAALLALGAADRALGRPGEATVHDFRWRRMVEGMGAEGMKATLERDAAWALDSTVVAR